MVTTPSLPSAADIAIVGAGLAGMSLAVLLRAACPHWHILLLDGQTRSNADSPEAGDVMATALSESSRQILLRAGLWSLLEPRAAPITDIHVSQREHLGSAHFSAAEQGLAAYGQVIENHDLATVLQDAIANCDNIDRIALKAIRLLPRRDGIGVEAGGQVCKAALVVIADGVESSLRAAIGIGVQVKDYHQSALLATLTLASNPCGIAWEHFTEDGPVALLPLPDRNGAHRASLVWTLSAERAAELATTAPELFIAALRDVFGARAGSINQVGPRRVRSLRRLLADEQVRSRLVLVGNAAHSLHPVAGQGFNLTLRDLAALTEALMKADVSGRALGDLAVLQDYLALQKADQARTIAFSDRLPALFAGNSQPGRLLARAANLGLMVLDLLPPLRSGFTRLGAGLLTREAHFVP